MTAWQVLCAATGCLLPPELVTASAQPSLLPRRAERGLPHLITSVRRLLLAFTSTWWLSQRLGWQHCCCACLCSRDDAVLVSIICLSGRRKWRFQGGQGVCVVAGCVCGS
jgi:hypothetical protein